MRGRTPMVIRRALSEPLLLVAALGSVLLATTTLVALMVYAVSVTEDGVRRAMETAPLSTRAVTVTTSVTARDFTRIDGLVRKQVADHFGGVPAQMTSSTLSDSYAMPGQEKAERPELTRFATYEGLDQNATLLSGKWPADGGASTRIVQASISEAAARAMSLSAGDRLSVVGRLDGRRVTVQITGVFRPGDLYGSSGIGDELLVSGVQNADYTTYGPLVVSAGTFLDRFTTSVSASWHAVPDLGGLPREQLASFAGSVAAIEPAVRTDCPDCTFSSLLPGMLTQLDRAALVARSTMLVPVLQLLVLAAYALTLTARLLSDHRTMEVALLRSRGGGSVRLAVLAGGEALLVALPCAVAAPFLAPVLLQLTSATDVRLSPPSTAAMLAVSAAVALACAVLLALPAIRSTRRTYIEERGSRGRGARQGILQRAGADVVLLVLAALAIWQMRHYGAPVTSTAGGGLGIDPLIVAGPALALLCGGMLGLRLLGPISALVERLTARGTGLASALGSRQVSRRPTRYSGPTLLLTMAVAIGVLSLATGSTWRASQDDQARHLAGADLRVAVPPGGDGRESTYKTLPGVTAVTGVHRSVASMGGGDVTLLGADAAKLGTIMLLRPDLSATPLAALTSRLAQPGTALPVVVTSGLAQLRTITIGSQAVPVHVVGTTASMPGTAAGTPAVLADLSALRAAKVPREATEWWISVKDHDTSRAVAALGTNPEETVTDLAALDRQLGGDPLAAGLQGALTLGFAAALAFALLGFLVNAAVSARERRAEFALLRALGVTFKQMIALLAVEQSFVIALSLAGGVLLAGIVAAVVVPAIVLTGQATAVTPPVLLDVPWPTVAALILIIMVSLLVVVGGLARSLHRRGPGGVLRSGEDR
ncbi:FtsX-like permease family protein [Planotetraspora phitsanulokensis]|nr:ABC transporter permease [Planotetraspora phitsanulokensis]